MHREREVVDESAERRAGLMVLALWRWLVGAGSGLIGAAFRLSLEYADRSRDFLIVWAHGQGLVGFLLVTGGCAVTVAAAAWLVRRFSPHASGSGIPHVEAVVREELLPASFSLIPVKFFGGLIAIGSGLALGRAACFVAMVIPTLLRDPPIYDSLRELTLRRVDEAPGDPVRKSRE